MKLKNAVSNRDRKVFKDNLGVSPVIAVILMVAITVVMAAIVSSWSAGVKAPTTPTTVGMDIARDTNNISIVVTSIDPAGSAPLPVLNVSYQSWDGSSFTTAYANKSNVDIGDLIEVNTNSSTLQKLIVIATFKDGSKKVLYSRDT